MSNKNPVTVYTVYRIISSNVVGDSNLCRVDDVNGDKLFDLMASMYDAGLLKTRVVKGQSHYLFGHITALSRHEYIAVPCECVVEAVAFLMQHEEWPSSALNFSAAKRSKKSHKREKPICF